MLRHMLQSRIVASRVLPPAWTCCSIGITQLSSTSHNSSSSSSSSDDGGAADAVSSTPTRKPRGRPRTSTTTATTTAKTATASTTTSTLNAAARPRGRPRSTASDAGVASSKAAARLAAIARQNAPLLIDRDPRNLQDEFVEREEDVPYPSMPLARDIVKRKTIYVHAKAFVDKVRTMARAGNGGDGVVSFHRDRFTPRGPPDGGNGGAGGSVIVRVGDCKSLVGLQTHHFKAGNGRPGARKNKEGRRGADAVVTVPRGTVVKLLPMPGEVGEPLVLADLSRSTDSLLLARGGDGGKGNSSLHWTKSRDRSPNSPIVLRAKGGLGEHKMIELELRMIANVGLVGYPNAGKSTLLRAISEATPKVAPYPFTTLHPILGVVHVPNTFARFTVADLPGLIDGAHKNRGLGHAFLRHIERTKALCFVLDMASIDKRDPIDDFLSLVFELEAYQPGLASRPCVIAANKMDQGAVATKNLERFTKYLATKPIIGFRAGPSAVVPISAKACDGTEQLVQALYELLSKLRLQHQRQQQELHPRDQQMTQ